MWHHNAMHAFDVCEPLLKINMGNEVKRKSQKLFIFLKVEAVMYRVRQ